MSAKRCAWTGGNDLRYFAVLTLDQEPEGTDHIRTSFASRPAEALTSGLLGRQDSPRTEKPFVDDLTWEEWSVTRGVHMGQPCMRNHFLAMHGNPGDPALPDTYSQSFRFGSAGGKGNAVRKPARCEWHHRRNEVCHQCSHFINSHAYTVYICVCMFYSFKYAHES